MVLQGEKIKVLPVARISTVLSSGRDPDRFKAQVRDRNRL